MNNSITEYFQKRKNISIVMFQMISHFDDISPSLWYTDGWRKWKYCLIMAYRRTRSRMNGWQFNYILSNPTARVITLVNQHEHLHMTGSWIKKSFHSENSFASIHLHIRMWREIGSFDFLNKINKCYKKEISFYYTYSIDIKYFWYPFASTDKSSPSATSGCPWKTVF